MDEYIRSTPVTLALVATNVLISILCFYNRKLYDAFKFNPPSVVGGQWWRVFTHAFVHADYIHLFFNMFALWQFGRMIEQVFKFEFAVYGTMLYLLLYGLAIIAASIPELQNHKKDIWYNSVGASGAVMAVVFVWILLFPTAQLLLFGGLPMPGVVFGGLYLLFSIYANQRGGDNIGHSAHIAGALFGIAFMIIFKQGVLADFWAQVKTLL